MVLSFFPSQNPKGKELESAEVLRIDGERVIMSAFKRMEVGDGWIVRLYNPDSDKATCNICSEAFGIQKRILLDPFQIQTFVLHEKQIQKVNLMEQGMVIGQNETHKL